MLDLVFVINESYCVYNIVSFKLDMLGVFILEKVVNIIIRGFLFFRKLIVKYFLEDY